MQRKAKDEILSSFHLPAEGPKSLDGGTEPEKNKAGNFSKRLLTTRTEKEGGGLVRHQGATGRGNEPS